MVIVADRRGNTDGVLHRVCELISSPLPIVLMAKTYNYKFNAAALEPIKDYILVEASEYGWNWDLDKSGTHIWGKNTNEFPQFSENEHYQLFDDWVKANPPKFTLKRELLKRDVTDTMKPIDYPCFYEAKEIQDIDMFNGRPVTAFYFWGRSHEARLRLHANIWMAASQKGFSVCDNISFFEKFVFEEDSKKWVSLNIPHYGRIDIRELLGRQQLSKFSIAMPGAGIKTFRHCESPINSVMVKWKDYLAWAYPWVGGENCIETEDGKEIESIEQASENPNLYDIYKAGVENCQR